MVPCNAAETDQKGKREEARWTTHGRALDKLGAELGREESRSVGTNASKHLGLSFRSHVGLRHGHARGVGTGGRIGRLLGRCQKKLTGSCFDALILAWAWVTVIMQASGDPPCRCVFSV